jgi:choline dehydrogenase-like flavoprotein
MIRDLLDSEGAVDLEADVAIVGAGTAGLVMAERLARAGRRIAVLEAGGRRQESDTHELNEVEQLGDVYSGAAVGRFRCLGGTSTRWGGAMLPFLPIDMEENGLPWSQPWPVAHEELMRHMSELEALFDLPSGPFEVPDRLPAADPDRFLPRMAKWPSFARRNVAALLDRRLASDDRIDVRLNAVVTDFELAADGRMQALKAQAPGGRSLRVQARQVVIAAGAIESTRLLLLLDRQQENRIWAPRQVIGRYLHDHLAAHSAALDPRDRHRLGALCGFRFEGSGMRNLRFEVAPQERRRAALPGGFVQIAFTSPERSGFDALRDIYRNAQRRRPPAAADLLLLARNAPWFANAAWARFVQKRLLVPPAALFELNVVVEQEPHRDNRIMLSADRADCFGQPLAAIDWRVRDADVANHARLFERFAAHWEQAGLDRIATMAPFSGEKVRAEMVAGGGTYHPGGTLRMAANGADGVVDANLVAFDIPNLSVVSTAVFPNGGAANPTFMLLLFALRAAERIARL